MMVNRVPEDEVEQERLRHLRNLYASQRAARHQRRGGA